MKHRRLRARIATAALAVYWIGLFVLTHLPRGPRLLFPHADKAAHAAGYAGLAFLLALAVMRGRQITPTVFAVLFAVACFYGAVDELMQIPIPTRNASLADLFADVWGVLGGLVAYAVLQATIDATLRRSTVGKPPYRL